MCKYAVDEMECIFEKKTSMVRALCFENILAYQSRKLASKLPIIKLFVPVPKTCRDFIGIPRTDDSWYKELFSDMRQN